ncbi:MAG: LPS export ABC transporter periplasmic protein LptC [Zoogloeaceae bacterium]|jgi:lipopolysaccharide export system protein LptC|nr:LPS export ABC transporter periplasmic protein LptC [Zoogloeaceae bacterium]
MAEIRGSASALSSLVAPLFPLFVLGALALLTFWLQGVGQTPPLAEDLRARHNPDSIAERVTMLRYDEKGRLAYRMTAKRLEHYPDDDSVLAQTPFLVRYRAAAPNVTVEGENALITENGKRVLLRGDVVLNRAAYAGRAALIARTPELTVFPDEGRAFNQHPVEIRQGEDWVTGVGLAADQTLSNLTLGKSVRGIFHSRESRTPVPSPKTLPVPEKE